MEMSRPRPRNLLIAVGAFVSRFAQTGEEANVLLVVCSFKHPMQILNPCALHIRESWPFLESAMRFRQN